MLEAKDERAPSSEESYHAMAKLTDELAINSARATGIAVQLISVDHIEQLRRFDFWFAPGFTEIKLTFSGEPACLSTEPTEMDSPTFNAVIDVTVNPVARFSESSQMLSLIHTYRDGPALTTPFVTRAAFATNYLRRVGTIKTLFPETHDTVSSAWMLTQFSTFQRHDGIPFFRRADS
ncbi:hypothetical protein EVAR_70763_1 [Eumeta japonica]|uniref:Uncharacterized protein n=1 Tax=Eumeta variegata TaxID=151549 RepID=A0A4C2A0M5_EUMVA|nr:hypothetical protein EVAR_70763_1 [Eumeta japonica]